MMRRKMRGTSEGEAAGVPSETKSRRGEPCHFSEEHLLRPLAPQCCRRPNCNPTGEKRASRGPEGGKNESIRIRKLTRCITESNF